MAAIEFFILENNQPVLSPVARTIDVYSKIIGTKGNENKLAVKELAYIYFMEDYRSPYIRNVPESEKIDIVERKLAMPVGWTESDLVKQARESYRDDQLTATTKALNEIAETLHSTVSLSSVIRKKIDTIGKQEDLTNSQTEEAIKMMKSLLDMSDKLQIVVKKVKELEQEERKEIAISGTGKSARIISKFQKTPLERQL